MTRMNSEIRNETDNDREVKGSQNNNSGKKITIIVLIAVLISAIVFTAIMFVNKQKNDEFNDYKDRFTLTLTKMHSESEKSLEVAEEYVSTWHDAIYDDSDIDFNLALALLYLELEEDGILESLETGKEEIDIMMLDLQDTHEDFEYIYIDLLDYYEVYIEIHNLAVDVQGSYNSYSASVNEVEKEIQNQYEKIKIRIPKSRK